MRPVSCVYDDFSLIYCNFYPSINYIFLFMSMTMMGLDLVPLVYALFHFALAIMLVVSVA